MFVMFIGVKSMTVGDLGMVRGFLVISRLVMFGCLTVVLRGQLVMLCGLLVVLVNLMVVHASLLWVVRSRIVSIAA